VPVAAAARVRELSANGAPSVLRRYADAWFEAARRRKAGQKEAGFPRRKRALIPVRWYHGTLMIEGQRVRLPVARGCHELWVRLARPLPYPTEQVRSVTLLANGGRLWMAVTAAVPKEQHDVDPGRVQNLRLRRWCRSHLLQALRDKAERAGIVVRLVDERGSSSTCPACRRRVPNPKKRQFSCPHCRFKGHWDLVGAHDIATEIGGGPTNSGVPELVEHRRAGVAPARRDRRRHLHDQRRRSCLASGHAQAPHWAGGCRSSRAEVDVALGEDQGALPNGAERCLKGP
jgi:hypothetical protein